MDAARGTRTAISPGIAVVLVLVCGVGFAPPVMAQQEELQEQMKLEQEIQLLNLFSGLYLTDEQMALLISKGKELQGKKEAYREEAQQQAQAATEVLQELKEEVETYDQDGQITDSVARDVHRNKQRTLQARAEFNQQAEAIVAEVKASLTSTQLHIIEEFLPCLVPPKGPARFGQAESGGMGSKQLERVRAMSAEEYELQKDSLLEKPLEMVRLHKRKGESIDEETIKAKILAIYDEARALSEVDFGWKKDQLAAQMKEVLKPAKEAEDVDQRIERFLLSPTATGILEGKLAEKKQSEPSSQQ